ncbi:unnamed protein product [Leuciscus chuanchicus]
MLLCLSDSETMRAGPSVKHKLSSGRQYVYFLPNHNPPAGVSDSETTQNRPECKTLDSVHAMPKTSVLLPCSEHPLQNRTDQVTWKIVTGDQSINIDQYRPPHKPSNSTERDPRPLYERVRILGNGSLFIRDAVNSDGLWYRCRVSEKICYEVKLVVKDSHSTTKLETLSTTCSTCHTAYSSVVQTKGNIDASSEVTTNLTLLVMVTIVSLIIRLPVLYILFPNCRRLRRNKRWRDAKAMRSHDSFHSDVLTTRKTCEKKEEGSVCQNRSARG